MKQIKLTPKSVWNGLQQSFFSRSVAKRQLCLDACQTASTRCHMPRMRRLQSTPLRAMTHI